MTPEELRNALLGVMTKDEQQFVANALSEYGRECSTIANGVTLQAAQGHWAQQSDEAYRLSEAFRESAELSEVLEVPAFLRKQAG